MSPTGGKAMKSPLTWNKQGGAIFDLNAAAAQADESERESAQVMRDLQRAGLMPQDLGLPGMGDIRTKESDPGEDYWNSRSMPRTMPKEESVARNRAPVRLPSPLKDVPEILDRAFRKAEKRLKCGVYFMQPQPHLKPIVTAISVDLFTAAAGVTLSSGSPLGNEVTILSITVPDRFIVVLDRFGNQLQDHLDFGSVTFSMQRNDAPLRSYGDFDVQLGEFIRPTPLGAPIMLTGNQTWALKAATTSTTKAFARIQGWAWAVKKSSNDGSYDDMHTQ